MRKRAARFNPVCWICLLLFAGPAVAETGQTGEPSGSPEVPVVPHESEIPPPPEDTQVIVDRLVALKGQGPDAVAAYRAALGHEEAEVRAAAVQLLSDDAGVEAVAALIPLVDDSSERVVVAASRALIHLGGQGSTEAVRKALQNGSSQVRAAVASYIGDYREARFLHDLGRLVSDRNPSVRMTAVTAIQALGEADGFRYLAAATADADREVVHHAVQGLVGLGNPAALPRLLRLADKDSSSIRAEVAYGIASLGGLPEHEAVFRALLGDRKSKVRAAALKGLRDRPTLAALPLIEEVLGLRPAPTTADGEPASSLETDDARLRRIGVLALKMLPDPAADDVLARLLDDPGERVRAASIMALTSRRTEAKLDRILEAASDPSAQVRFVVAAAAGEFGEPSALGTVARLAEDADTEVRAEAARSAGRIGTPAALEILVTALKDEVPAVRLGAVDGLAAMATPEALELLRRALDDDDPRVRIAAIRAAGSLGDHKAVPKLREIARDPAEALRREARNALRDIGPAEEAVERTDG